MINLIQDRYEFNIQSILSFRLVDVTMCQLACEIPLCSAPHHYSRYAWYVWPGSRQTPSLFSFSECLRRFPCFPALIDGAFKQRATAIPSFKSYRRNVVVEISPSMFSSWICLSIRLFHVP